MALQKEGYAGAIQATTKVKVPIDDEGYLAPEGTESAGSKNISITKVAAENSLQDNTDVLAFFLDLANGTQDSLTNTMTVQWGV